MLMLGFFLPFFHFSFFLFSLSPFPFSSPLALTKGTDGHNLPFNWQIESRKVISFLHQRTFHFHPHLRHSVAFNDQVIVIVRTLNAAAAAADTDDVDVLNCHPHYSLFSGRFNGHEQLSFGHPLSRFLIPSAIRIQWTDRGDGTDNRNSVIVMWIWSI